MPQGNVQNLLTVKQKPVGKVNEIISRVRFLAPENKKWDVTRDIDILHQTMSNLFILLIQYVQTVGRQKDEG